MNPQFCDQFPLFICLQTDAGIVAEPYLQASVDIYQTGIAFAALRIQLIPDRLYLLRLRRGTASPHEDHDTIRFHGNTPFANGL